MSFLNFAQTFYVDPESVDGAAEIGITKVDLYFRAKPREINNKSGIQSPGVDVYLVPCINRIPQLQYMNQISLGKGYSARKEWNEIIPSTDASIPTPFVFDMPIFIRTNFEYAFLVKFDGDEDFILWSSKTGDYLLGTTTVSQGPSNRFIGNLFGRISFPSSLGLSGYGYSDANLVSSTANSSALIGYANTALNGSNLPDNDYLQRNWNPITNNDLKFRIFGARYSHRGIPIASNGSILANNLITGYFPSRYSTTVVSNNVLQLFCPCAVNEYVKYDYTQSSVERLYVGEFVYQNQPNYPGGTATPLTISVTANSANITANGSYIMSSGVTFNNSNGFNSIFDNTIDDQFIVIVSGNTVNVRKVTSINSNTSLTLDSNVEFTNTIAYFFRAPVGRLSSHSYDYAFGQAEYMFTLTDSSAISACRFVNNQILSVNVTANGTGYSNSDYMTISGFENISGVVEGGYVATANIRTNNTGNVVAVYMSNLGCGFVNTSWIAGANVIVSNSSGTNTTGSGATFTFEVGATLKTERSNSTFANCSIVNMEASKVYTNIVVNNPLGSAYLAKLRTLYHVENYANAFSGKAYYINDTPSDTDILIRDREKSDFKTGNTVVLPSRSNEYVINYANGVDSNTTIIGDLFSNASVMIFEFSANNDWSYPFFDPRVLETSYCKYVINNDYTNEHTNYGNAYAKHVSKRLKFKDDRIAEDIRVYLTAYKPANTDIQVYVRVHNSSDPEAFDDKDWTRLDLIDGIGVYSSKSNEEDLIELTYGFQNCPNLEFRLAGTVTLDNVTTTTITGSGTTFSSNLAVNDIVKISQPLFPNNYSVSVITAIANNTSLTIAEPIANNGMVGSGLILEKIEFPKQAFNNGLNDNVVRYYNESLSEFDGYDTFQLKLILLSTSDRIVPKIDDVQAVGVTA